MRRKNNRIITIISALLKITCIVAALILAILLNIAKMKGTIFISKSFNQTTVGELNITPAILGAEPKLYRRGGASIEEDYVNNWRFDEKDPAITEMSLPDGWRLDWKDPTADDPVDAGGDTFD